MDDRVRDLVDVVRYRNGDGKGFDASEARLEREIRSLVTENFMLKHDLDAAVSSLKRIYPVLERLTDNPAFRRMLEEMKDGDAEDSNG